MRRAVVQTAERRLEVVRAPPARDGGDPAPSGDVGLTAMIFLVAALPLASVLAGVGRWDEASLGLGTLGVILAGRELVSWLGARWRSRRRP
jgi:hypothetical protein